jgi:O-antigen ligase
LLVGLLVGVVPVFALTTDVPSLALVAAAGLVYLLVLFYTETGFEGLASATIVLSIFDIGVTLAQGPSYIPPVTADLTIVDFVAIPLLFVFLHYGNMEFSVRDIEFNGRTIAAVALAVFVVWTALAGIVANGESSTVPLLYTVEFFRYALLLALSALIVRETNVWCVIYPLILSIGGNLAFALAQVINGGGFGLHALGETASIILGRFTFGPLSIRYGSYAGGFVGHSREFTLILLLFIPLVLAVATRHSWLHVLYALVSVAVAVLVIRTADTDTGWAALLLTGVLLVSTFGYAALRERHRGAAVGVLATGIAATLTAVVVAVAVILAASAQVAPNVPLFDTGTLPIRIEQYVTALDIARDHPLFGLGGGNFYLMAENFGLPGLRGIHALVFSYLAATGFVGAAAFVIGTVAVLAVAFRRFLRGTGSKRLLWGALVCGMVGFYAYSFWDLAHLWDSALSAFWILMGVVIGADTGETTTAE